MIYHQDVFIRMALETMPTRTNRHGGVMPSHSTPGGLSAAEQFNRSGTVTPLALQRYEIFTAPVELNEDTNKAMW